MSSQENSTGAPRPASSAAGKWGYILPTVAVGLLAAFIAAVTLWSVIDRVLEASEMSH